MQSFKFVIHLNEIIIMRLTISIILGLIFSLSAFAQGHICGTHETPASLKQLKKNRELLDRGDLRSAPRYIPVTFHLAAENDGTGRIAYGAVLDQLCKMNRDYADLEMVFYLSEMRWNEIDNSGVYNNPNASLNIDNIVDNKDPNAMNIFVTENADTGGNSVGVTLGFYTFFNDYIITRKAELVDTSSTISHEAGHFFSLRHPHYGWEDAPWEESVHGTTVTLQTVGSSQTGGSSPVEKVDGSNCTVAADLVCDTPPDYNFGITSGGCNFTYEVYDCNGDQVFPQVNNYMGYFGNCAKYQFTEEQGDLMRIDFDSPRRSYLRSDYVPNLNEVEGPVVVNSPSQGQTVDFYNSVTIEWDAVANATDYLITVTGNGQSTEYFRDTNYLFLDDLEPNTTYFYFIKPFNETSACVTSPTQFFQTSDAQTSTEDIQGFSDFSIFPNPLYANDVLNIRFESSIQTKALIKIFDTKGALVKELESNIVNGSNTISADTRDLNTGSYVFNMTLSDGKSMARKFVIN